MSEKLSLRQKLAKVYDKIEFIAKAGDNKKQGYKFVRAADVLHAIRNSFLELGLYAQTNYDLLGTYNIPTSSGGNMHAATVKATITLHDVESNESLVISGLGDGADGGDKGIYKAQTGATKNALRNAFLVPDEADPEADETVDEATQEQPSRRPTPAKERIQPIAQEVPVSQPPKAEIPDNGNASPSANPSPLKTDKPGKLPTKAEFEEIKNKVVALQKTLRAAGLKPSASLPVNKKVLNYLYSLAGVNDAEKLSLAQWTVFFELMDKATQTAEGTQALIEKINAVAEGK